MKYKMIFSYYGINFAGYQIQKNKRTVQEEIEKMLFQLFQENIRIYSSGRTDKGVHALNQVASFKTSKDFKPSKLKYVLNRLLPDDIHVKSVEYCEDDFHARFSAIGKRYIYKMVEGENDPILNNLIYYYQGEKLDYLKMLEAKDMFIGKHNFKNFCSSKDEESYDETIYDIKIDKVDNAYTFTFVGSGFKRYMVRILVGTILAVSKGKYTLKQIEEKLISNIHQNVSFKVPPQGLYLDKVFYEGDDISC